jgi:hypothetical protein
MIIPLRILVLVRVIFPLPLGERGRVRGKNGISGVFHPHPFPPPSRGRVPFALPYSQESFGCAPYAPVYISSLRRNRVREEKFLLPDCDNAGTFFRQHVKLLAKYVPGKRCPRIMQLTIDNSNDFFKVA